MILLIDNYDSFSYNLYQLVGEINPDIKVIRNNEMTAAEIEKLNPEFIVISPGPKTPSQAGECINIIKELGSKISILGVCLGHQSIVEAYGGKVSNAKRLVHGKADNIKIDTSHPMFKDMDSIIKVARYHSLSAGMRAIRMNFGWFKDKDLRPDVPVITDIIDVLKYI